MLNKMESQNNLYKKLKEIPVKKIELYLAMNGWEETEEYKTRDRTVYAKEFDTGRATAVIPTDNSYNDYPYRIHEVLETVGREKGITVEEQANTLLKPMVEPVELSDNDKLSIRIISDKAKNNSLPISYASQAITSLLELLEAAINMEEDPQKYYYRSSSSAKRKVNKFKLGQTEPGSYIFNIELEPEEAVQESFFDESDEININRNAIYRIQRGIDKVIQSNVQRDMDTIYEKGYKEGFNANMCDAIVGLRGEDQDIEIETTMQMSMNVDVPEDIPIKTNIKTNEFNLFKDISETYKKSPLERKLLAGNIISINAKDKTLTFNAEVGDSNRNIQIEKLDNKSYIEACEALKYNNNEIEILGVLDKSTRHYKMIDIEKLDIKYNK